MKIKYYISGFILCLLFASVVFSPKINAQQQSDFSLQVSPSPLVLTVKPGETLDTELKIRNLGSKHSDIKIELREFEYNSTTEKIELKDSLVPDTIKSALAFDDYSFSLDPNQVVTRKIKVSPPRDSKFAYSFAIVLKKTNTDNTNDKTRKIKGEVAVFTLLDVDKNGVKKEIKLESFATDKKSFDYLPVGFKTKFTNKGNTFNRPYGNIYIGRTKNSTSPVAVLPVNPNGSYILPGTTRSTVVDWQDGFPRHETSSDGKSKVSWNFRDLNKLRIGKYHAKLVAVYNDGARDVPVEADLSFWVMPWKIIFIIVLIILAVGLGLFTIIRSTFKLGQRIKRRK